MTGFMKKIVSECREARQEAENEQKEHYSAEYYARVGEHGELGNWPDFNTAYKKAMDLYKREKKAGTLGDDDTWYIGVSGSGKKFAIIYVNDKYIHLAKRTMEGPNYPKWKSIAQKVKKTGKPQTGSW